MPHAINVNNNISAMNVRHLLSANSSGQSKRLERMSSGMRINSAEDDASGLTISEGFRAQITGMQAGSRNAEMGMNLLQVAEGSLNEVSAMMIRMKELAVQSASSTMNQLNREAIEAETTQLKQEIDRIANSSVYNNQTLLTAFGNTADETLSTAVLDTADTGVSRVVVSGTPKGTYTFLDDAGDGQITLGNGTVSQTISMATSLDGSTVATGTTAVANFDRLGVVLTLAGEASTSRTSGTYVDGDLNTKTIIVSGGAGGSFQVGADNTIEDRLEVGIEDMRASGAFLNLNSLSMSTLQNSRQAITQIDAAIEKIAQTRGDLGAAMNRLQHTINFQGNSIENNTNSEATLRDADIAEEVTNYTKMQVLTQTATAMLTQANASPQAALILLQGS